MRVLVSHVTTGSFGFKRRPKSCVDQVAGKRPYYSDIKMFCTKSSINQVGGTRPYQFLYKKCFILNPI